jgi:hypothetical protein
MESSISIAVPNNPVYDVFVEHFTEQVGSHRFRLLRTTDDQCAELLLNNRVEIAFITPLGYGSAVTRVDYRIVPLYAFMSHGFTGLGSVYFNPSLKSIYTIGTQNKNSFMTCAGQLILSEKFDIDPIVQEQSQGTVDTLLASNDAAIAWTNEDHREASLDISEEWKDSFGLPLCMGFWACRPDELPENIADILKGFCGSSKRQLFTDAEHIPHDDEDIDLELESRVGALSYEWNDESESIISTTLEILYYRQKVAAISAVKLWERD